MSEHRLQSIIGFVVVTADLSRLVRFYQEVLGFSAQGEPQRIDPAEMALLGLAGEGRRQVLSVGRQSMSIDQFDQPGRAYPADSNAASLWFQHLALVVDDIAGVYGRLREAAPISQAGPQQLPRSSGGAIAFKFRDPDGHPLEFLQFPMDETPDAWRGRHPLPGEIALGIDHSAISVAEADASAGFYGGLGLAVGKRTFNEGPAQQSLDDLHGVEVAVVPMLPPQSPPHLELLGYQVPKGERRPARRANDVAATRIVWRGSNALLLRDPDGHLQQVQP